ncbi:MAG: ATP-binding protein [Alphaproteobacteria bacterium]
MTPKFDRWGNPGDLKRAILIPFITFVALVIGGATLQIYWHEQDERDRNMEIAVDRVHRTIDEILDERYNDLKVVASLISDRKEIVDAFVKMDRTSLYNNSRDIYDSLSSSHMATHLYFIDTDRTTFLRVHAPQTHGDVINRTTLLRAEKSGSVEVGLEMGLLGTLTARVVMPWMNEDRRIGYIELGIELGDVLLNSGSRHGLQSFLFIPKKFLDRRKWEEGMEMLGRPADWDRFSDLVLVANTGQRSTSLVARIGSLGEVDGISHVTDRDGTAYALSRLKFYDVGGRELAFLFLLEDPTGAKDSLESPVAVFIQDLLVGGGILGLVLWSVVRRVERHGQSLGQANRELGLAKEALEARTRELGLIETRQRAILDTTADGLTVIDEHGAIALFNKSAEVIFGHSATDVIGQDISILFPPAGVGDSGDVLYHFKEASVTPTGVRLERMARRKSGKLIPVELAMADASVLDRRFIVATFQDIRWRKTMEKRLQEALEHQRAVNAEQRAFVAMANHEFRTPLAIIDGAAQLLLRHSGRMGGAEISEKLQQIRSAVQRMTEQMESTLILMRSDSGAVVFSPGPCDLAELVRAVCVRQAILSPSHEIVIDVGRLPATIVGDKNLLDHVVSNLISNAAKYSGEDRYVYVTGYAEDGYAVVSVEDHGLGIEQDDIPKLFQRFFRGSATQHIRGTGIGLSLVKQFVEMHGGTVAVESRIGRGSTFTVRLPISLQNF